jgi:polar amino acid transport system substrate-binding protein
MTFNISAKSLNFAATEWCPYTCSKMKNQGIVSEYLKEVFKKQGIEINVLILPWERAITQVSSGKIDGLLTAVESEAPKLKFTKYPTMSYRSCAFSITPPRTPVTFNNLNTFNIGVLAKYSYGKEFDNFFLTKKNKQNAFVVKGNNGLQRLYKLAKKRRIDFFLEDEKVAKYSIKKDITPVLCGTSNPFYIGFNPYLLEVDNIIQKLDIDLKNSINLLNSILKTNNLN